MVPEELINYSKSKFTDPQELIGWFKNTEVNFIRVMELLGVTFDLDDDEIDFECRTYFKNNPIYDA